MMTLEDLDSDEGDDKGRRSPPRRLVSSSGTNSGNPSNASANLARQNVEDKDQDNRESEERRSKMVVHYNKERVSVEDIIEGIMKQLEVIHKGNKNLED